MVIIRIRMREMTCDLAVYIDVWDIQSCIPLVFYFFFSIALESSNLHFINSSIITLQYLHSLLFKINTVHIEIN